jgi:hypothetical protein
MPSLELRGVSAVLSEKGIAMGRTRVIWQQRRVESKISRCEDDREGQFHTQMFDRYSEYPQSRRSSPNLDGRCP